MLNIEDLNVIYEQNTPNQNHVLKNLSLYLDKGDFISIIGGNGAGKSTLLSAIAGNAPVSSGRIELDGQDLGMIKSHTRANTIGRLFQDPLKGTAPNMTIEENLSLAYGRGKYPGLSRGVKKQNLDVFKEKLAQFSLGLENRLTDRVKNLSGGQRQALTLVMATIKTPKLLLLDEHTAALDPKTALKVMEQTNSIIGKYNITTLMITHNLSQAIEYGNKIAMISNGKIVCLIDKKTNPNITKNDLMKLYSEEGESEFSDRNILE